MNTAIEAVLERPATPPPALSAIPEELKEHAQWVLWKWEQDKAGKWTKVPYQPNGRKALTTNRATWASFKEAVASYRTGGYAGIGFVFAADDPYCGIDLDKCHNPDTGEIEEWAWNILRDLDTYSEVSPSGKGVKAIARGQVPKAHKGARVELYCKDRFFTLTGERLEGLPKTIEDARDAIAELFQRLEAERGRSGNGAAGVDPDGVDWNEFADQGYIHVKLGALLTNNERFRRSWEHDRPDLEDQSLSSYDLALCSIAAGTGWSDTELYLLIRAHREQHGSDKGQRADYVRRTIARARERGNGFNFFGYRNGKPPGAGEHEAAAAEAPAEADVAALARCLQSDTGNAERLLARFGRDVVWTTHAHWHVWDGRRWCQDERQQAVKLAQEIARLIFDECKFIEDPDAQKARTSWAVRSHNRSKVEGMLAMAAPHVSATPDELDRDPWLFNVANGTVDLRTGELRGHRRGDRLTKLAPVAYDPNAEAPAWAAFLRSIFPADDGTADEDLIQFVQRAVGYSLTGDTSEQVLFILHGGGSNGKSTPLEVLAALLGDYGQQTPTDTFMVKDRGGGIPNDIARLRGARFVSAVETERDRRLAESLVKQATGGDRMTGRFLHREFFEFTPAFKLWLATNYKPEVRGTDDAIWRRLRLIPLEVKFWRENDPERPEEAPVVDKKLKAKLLAELPGILGWAVRGCLEWQRHGLGEPEKVLAATAAYRSEMDRLGDFLADVCLIGDIYSIRASELYGEYRTWCQENGEEPQSQTAFGRAMIDRGFRKEMGQYVVYRGLTVKP